MEEEQWQRGREVMQESLEFAEAGQPLAALKVLDTAIAEAIRDGRRTWAKILCQHAAILSGDRQGKIKYEEQALPFAPDYRFAAYNFAQLLLSDGQAARAERFAEEAYQLSIAEASDADRDLVAAILKQWPNIGENP